MAQITFKGDAIETIGTLPSVGTQAPDFQFTKSDLSETSLADYAGKKVVLNIFPSIDTGICAASARKFNAEATALENTVILCVSRDLPFAHGRFCEAEGLQNVIPVSEFRTEEFGKNYGVTIKNSPLAGLFSRAVVILDEEGLVIYTEQVPEIAQEPNYASALEVLA